jgi:hypothetical protein
VGNKKDMVEIKNITRRRLKGRITEGGDGNGRPVTNGDYRVEERERGAEKSMLPLSLIMWEVAPESMTQLSCW